MTHRLDCRIRVGMLFISHSQQCQSMEHAITLAQSVLRDRPHMNEFVNDDNHAAWGTSMLAEYVIIVPI